MFIDTVSIITSDGRNFIVSIMRENELLKVVLIVRSIVNADYNIVVSFLRER